MRRVKKTLFNNGKGLTLVEVLASIVILSIIMISILMILLQTAKTNKTSEEIIDATYIAQMEMENIYDDKKSWLEDKENGYDYQGAKDGWEVYRKTVDEDEDYIIQVSLKQTDSKMTRVLIRVYDSPDATKPKTQMENLFDWSAGE